MFKRKYRLAVRVDEDAEILKKAVVAALATLRF
jgi:hypothetical protein